MVSKEQLEQLKELRAAGVKSIELHTNREGKTEAAFVEFFPISAFDRAGALLDGEEDETPEARAARDTEAPPAVNVPPAMARVLQKGSVS